MATAYSLRALLLLSLFLLNSFQSESAVASIDLGSEWVKVAVVSLKPGQPPISIAINEMSKRKTPSLISFHADSRLIGEESLNLLARYPTKVFSHLPSLIGKPYNFTRDFLSKLYLSYEIAPDETREVAVFKAEAGDFGNFTAEEMVGMILKYAVNLAEIHARTTLKDVVITVPPFIGVAERKSLLAAADLAGLNVLALVHEHSGAALQYGIDKDFSNGSRHVVFYDMGASSTYAALVYFSAYNAKELGKTVSVNQFQVKDVKWDAELGGQNMELRLVEYFADEFNKQLGNGVDIRTSPKAMAKLKKQVKRTKEILSANMMAPISVESLYDDRDFRSTITREKFEELCEDLWEKALVPIKEVLKHSGLNAADLFAVELIGGATRVPKLQAKLQEFLGKSELDKHLDADEAIVLGASLHAANLSDGIKLNRKLGMIDGSTYGFVFELDGDGLSKDENTRQLIVPRMKKLPSKMFRSVVHNKDFEVTLAYESEDLIPPGASSLIFAKYDVSGLTDASEKYSSRNLSSPIKANLHFSLSRSGVFSLDRAEAVVEITEWVEVPRKNLTVDNSTSASTNNTDADAKNASVENSEKLEANNGSSNVSDSNANDSSTVDLGLEKKLKKRTFRVALKVTEKTTGPGMPLSEESFAEAKRKLEALDKKDAERKRTAELKNNLEGYIYSTKDKLESEEFAKISSEKERQSFLEKLNEVEDWLYTDGEDASASEFQERLDMLKAIGDPIFFRYNELTARPAASEHAERYLKELQEIVQGWEKNKPWLPKERIDEVVRGAEKFKNWLSDKEAEQQKTSGFSKPAFTSDEVYEKILDLQDKVASINRIPKPKPKVEKPAKVETESVDDKANTTDSESRETPSSEDKPTSDSDNAANDKTNAESNVHDEL
ncbi:Molecular chaperones GRP170/SIL1, HSP70 superfamily [Handroanthus impetiginosus]|uniref:Molecular chaperones GRP170/SIL1, HSP70 superfamily n=1 Tax=Handroanthus impetiginosus TaxID=429701 RepID=A0A2G9HS84_9LAMI|nr:Molecular chaperones GRP170/SIL1, HSP70 superfamily [Handroanthus impetiginosus]